MSDDTKDLVERLRLGGPNAMEVSGEAADAIEAAQDRCLAAERARDDFKARFEKNFDLRHKAEARLAEVEEDCDRLIEVAKKAGERCAAAETERDAARAAAIAECVKVITENQETIRETSAGSERYLSPRRAGNLAGLAFADGLRALSDHQTGGEHE